MRHDSLGTPRRSGRTSRANLPASKGARPKKIGSPKLREVEQTLFILMSHQHIWYLVDEFVGSTAQASAMRQALVRRGCDVQQRKAAIDDRIVQVWARWTHPVPDGVADWELTFK